MVKRGCSSATRLAKPQQVQNDDDNVNGNGDHFETKDKSFRITAKRVIYSGDIKKHHEETLSPMETEPARISFARTRWGE